MTTSVWHPVTAPGFNGMDTLQEAYKEAVKVAPMKAQTEKAVYHCNASQSYIKLEQFQDAVREATSCLKLRPNNAIKMKALLRRAQSYEELKEVMRAYPDYEKVQHPSAPSARNCPETHVGFAPEQTMTLNAHVFQEFC